MKHFYFKFLTGNKGIEIWENFKSREDNSIDLSIYYGKWKAKEYETKIKEPMHFLRRNQINLFFNLKNFDEDIFFWIYYKEKILCFRAVDLNVYDGPKKYNCLDKKNELESYPKSIKAELIQNFKKIDEPDFFSNINSNQGYNRMTITELNNSELEYANSLINKIKINVDLNNFYKYISPMQFETILFLIFSNEISFCSAFRGGTLKNYDLKISLKKSFNGIPAGKHWLQVKLKDDIKINIDGYLVYTGKTNLENKTIGIDWIKERIRERKDILNWLQKCVFDVDLINFTIDNTLSVPVEFDNSHKIRNKENRFTYTSNLGLEKVNNNEDNLE